MRRWTDCWIERIAERRVGSSSKVFAFSVSCSSKSDDDDEAGGGGDFDFVDDLVVTQLSSSSKVEELEYPPMLS